MMRPVRFLLIALLVFLLIDAGLLFAGRQRRVRQDEWRPVLVAVTAALGLTDLCVATEARYTRHPAVSDPVAPFMDHPGAIEHFPSGSFWAPPPR